MKCIPNLLCAIMTLSVSQVLMSVDAPNDSPSYLKNSESLNATTAKYADGKLLGEGGGVQLLLSAG